MSLIVKSLKEMIITDYLLLIPLHFGSKAQISERLSVLRTIHEGVFM